ncbi:MAG: hypothetical protein HQL56_18595 [Magnetococcales bacterium]|nr:hypothetical protein [Magnetococcales bacterium]
MGDYAFMEPETRDSFLFGDNGFAAKLGREMRGRGPFSPFGFGGGRDHAMSYANDSSGGGETTGDSGMGGGNGGIEGGGGLGAGSPGLGSPPLGSGTGGGEKPIVVAGGNNPSGGEPNSQFEPVRMEKELGQALGQVEKSRNLPQDQQNEELFRIMDKHRREEQKRIDEYWKWRNATS